jgi:hypothetical protein
MLSATAPLVDKLCEVKNHIREGLDGCCENCCDGGGLGLPLTLPYLGFFYPLKLSALDKSRQRSGGQ